MRPVFRILTILILTMLICTAVYKVLQKGLKKYNNHTDVRLSEILEKKTNYDLLFIGSSRTHTSINPRIIDSVTHLKSYNAGVEGGNLLEFKMIFDGYLISHPAPRCLVLTIDLYSFNIKRPFFNYTQYFNYLNNPVIDSSMNANRHNTFILKYFPVSMLTDYDDYLKGNAVKGLLNKGREIKDGEFQYGGYLSNTNKGIDAASKEDLPETTLKIDADAIAFLSQIISTCKERKIKLIFTYAPEYNFKLQNRFINKSNVFEKICQVANRDSILFLRHDSLPLCKSPDLFANFGHLNSIGASEYSVFLANELKSYLNL